MSQTETRELPPNQWKNGPGGHWLRWEATDGKLYGYGQTAAEATRDLKAKQNV